MLKKGIGRRYMQISIRQLTGAFRPLCVTQQSYRVPAHVSFLSPSVGRFDSLTQTPRASWQNLSSFCSAQAAHIGPPAEGVEDLSDLQDEFPAVVSHDLTSKVSRQSSASARVLDDSQHSIKASSLPAYAWPFLTKLHLAGHDVFVVGGTVRDLLLNQEPKDLDLVTTATLHQVKNIASRCYIVGHRHPIALVHASHKKIIEVSTFQSPKATLSDAAELARQGRQGKLRPHHLDKPWGALWQDNMQQRDFTLNAMMYNPFSHLLFDYVGGLADCNKRRLHCCKDPSQSFQEDPVRMLRAVRLAARCDLKVSSEVDAAIKKGASQLGRVSGSRLYGEAIIILSHGASLNSFQLMWRLHMLDEIMLPYAEYARKHKVPRTKSLPDNMTTWPLLLRLLSCMDKRASVEQPVAMQVVAAVLAAPFVVDTISAHRAELENMISGKSAKLSKKTTQRLSAGHEGTQGDQTLPAAVMQGAVLCWEARRRSGAEVNTTVQQQRLLMACIIDAALETLRTRLPTGLLPRANISGADRLLMAFYTSLKEDTQEDAADRGKPHTAPESPGFRKAKHISFLAKQNMVNNVFHEAEPHWQSLLL